MADSDEIPYGTVRQAVSRAADAVHVEMHSVSDAAEKWLRLDIPQGYKGPFRQETTPYTKEPLEELTKRSYQAVVLVASQQSAKTEIIPCWSLYSAKVDPSDLIVYEKTREAAQGFEMQRISRPLKASPAWLAELGPRKNDDNTFTKKWRNGAYLFISWPTINTMSGKPIARVALTDYDRMPQDIDGNGAPFDLALKRNETFLSRGMTLAESSPGFPVIDPEAWNQQEHDPHEAPPTLGILALYNRGDRRRWYWPCLNCGEYFIGEFKHLTGYEHLVGKADWVTIRQSVSMACPHCGEHLKPGLKAAMNRRGVWVPQGQRVAPSGELLGKKTHRSPIASFWLPGPAAFRQDWGGMVVKYLQALEHLEKTGEEEPLKVTTQSDQCMPYVARARQRGRTADSLKRREESFGERVIPRGVRFLTTSIDVQGGRRKGFVVKVMGWGVDLECWIIDYFNISTVNGAAIDPAAHPEHWDVITREVIHRVYPLADNSNRWMGSKLTICDSGGDDGVTDNAYAYWRRLETANLIDRFMLIKGRGSGARIQKTEPERVVASDARGKKMLTERLAVLYLLNVNLWKDGVDAQLAREKPGPGFVHFPRWLDLEYYRGLVSEIRSDDGKWDKPSHGRKNEPWDLFVYGRAGAHAAEAHLIDWSNPPAWAKPWNENSLVLTDLSDHHFKAVA